MKKTIIAGLSTLFLLSVVVGLDGGTFLPIWPPIENMA